MKAIIKKVDGVYEIVFESNGYRDIFVVDEIVIVKETEPENVLNESAER